MCVCRFQHVQTSSEQFEWSADVQGFSRSVEPDFAVFPSIRSPSLVVVANLLDVDAGQRDHNQEWAASVVHGCGCARISSEDRLLSVHPSARSVEVRHPLGCADLPREVLRDVQAHAGNAVFQRISKLIFHRHFVVSFTSKRMPSSTISISLQRSCGSTVLLFRRRLIS